MTVIENKFYQFLIYWSAIKECSGQKVNIHGSILRSKMVMIVVRFREWIGTAVVGALRRGSAACSHAALDAVCALMQPMHHDPDLRQEQLNKASMLSSATFLEGLLAMWAEHVVSD
jgi:hypothetical protein